MKKLLLLLLFVFTLPAVATGISGASAPCDNATLAKYNGTADIEINWEPNTINLNWYNGDEKLTVANNSQSCVYDGTLTVPAQPTKPGYTFNGWKVIRVPGGYTELEYLESTGKQYIDTGIIATNYTKVEFMVDRPVAPQHGTSWTPIATTLDEINGQFAVFESTNAAGEKYVAFTYGKVPVSVVDTRYGTTSFNKSTFVLDGGILTYDNGSHTVTSTQAGQIFNTTHNICLFGRSEYVTNSNINVASTRMYYVKIWQNGNLVRNFIPARRNSDNVVGMYDSITNQFFTNAGTGSFVAGPVVQ